MTRLLTVLLAVGVLASALGMAKSAEAFNASTFWPSTFWPSTFWEDLEKVQR